MFAQCEHHVVDFGGGGMCLVVLCVFITMTYSFPKVSLQCSVLSSPQNIVFYVFFRISLLKTTFRPFISHTQSFFLLQMWFGWFQYVFS